VLIASAFLVSGVAALIVQVAWSRWLTLVLGSSTRATIVVLAAFMGGLGLGSWLAGALADRHARSALRLFGFAEIGVGAWSLISIPLLGSALPQIAASMGSAGSETGGMSIAMRAALAVGALAIPTVLMGATLPFLARWAVTDGGLPGRDIGDLYTLNTLGGAIGALAAAFLLVDALGLSASVALSGGLDIAVGVLAIAVAAKSRGAEDARAVESSTAADDAEAEADPYASGSLLVGAALAFAVSGFCGLGLEVIAYRVIAVLAGSSAYAYGAMLGAFLIGIGAGSFVGSRFADRVANPAAALGLTLAGLAAGIGIALHAFESGAWSAAGRIARSLPGLGAWSYGFELFGCLAVLLPATLMLGIALPLVARIAGRAPARLARRFGTAYALNTLGAVLGTILVGLWLVPAYGSARASMILLGLAGATGVLLVILASSAGPKRALGSVALAVVLVAVGLGIGFGDDPVREHLLAPFDPQRVLAFDEGPVQTIAVVSEKTFQQRDFLRLVTNRTSLTGTHLYAKRYMRLLGHLPAAWSSDPSRGLVICLGTGMTVAAVASHDDVERVDVAEISPAVVQVAGLFDQATGGVLDHPKVELFVEDGRHVLLASDAQWGFVTLEPPPPRDSGVVSLYTTDFYELARSRLVPGGVVAQWVPLHSQSLAEIEMLVASFLEVFPHVIGFLPVERELLLIGSDEPLARDLGLLQSRLASAEAEASLAPIGLDDAAALAATAVADRELLEEFADGAPLITDDRPRVEYFARYGKRPALDDVSALISRPMPIEEILGTNVSAPARERFAASRAALLASVRAAWLHEQRRVAEATQQEIAAIRARPDDPYYLWAAQLSDEHLADLRRHAEATGAPADWRQLARRLADRRMWTAAGEAYLNALRRAPDDLETLVEFGNLLLGPLGRPADGRAMLTRFLQVAPDHPMAPAVRQRLAAAGGDGQS
jgi:spermidine synthase